MRVQLSTVARFSTQICRQNSMSIKNVKKPQPTKNHGFTAFLLRLSYHKKDEKSSLASTTQGAYTAKPEVVLMENRMEIRPAALQLAAAGNELAASNSLSQRYGLSLTDAEIQTLAGVPRFRFARHWSRRVWRRCAARIDLRVLRFALPDA